MDVTNWMRWFLGCLSRAIENSETALDIALSKARFWERIAGIPINERLSKIINLMLNGFRGKLTPVKWAKIGKCDQETAGQDIAELINHGILAKTAESGRSLGYALVNAGGIHRHSASQRRRAFRAPRGSGARHRRGDIARRPAGC